MAHNLYQDSMVYAGETPWHGLGVALPRNATWSEVQGIVPFYQAVERPLFVAGIAEQVPDRKALVASTDGRYLSVVGKDYGVVQFADLAEAVMTAAQGEAVFHTAGLLGENGIRGWLMGELPNPIQVPGDPSPVRKYFLATTSHDGTSAAVLANIATRVVCQNTLGAALGERSGARWTIRHTSGAQSRVKEAGIAFARMREGMERFGELANVMARTAFGDDRLAKMLDGILPVPVKTEEVTDRQIENVQVKRETIKALASGQGRGIVTTIQGTAWGAFQAVTEYADHYTRIRARPMLGDGQMGQLASRLNANVFGSGQTLKREALASILDLTGIKVRVQA